MKHAANLEDALKMRENSIQVFERNKVLIDSVRCNINKIDRIVNNAKSSSTISRDAISFAIHPDSETLQKISSYQNLTDCTSRRRKRLPESNRESLTRVAPMSNHTMVLATGNGHANSSCSNFM